MEIERHCAVCGKTVIIKNITLPQLTALSLGNDFIQNILPNHTAGEREMLISEICEECWDELFPEDLDESFNEEDE